MSQYVQNEEQRNTDSVALEAVNNSEISGFGKVMSQMNIADRQCFDIEYAQCWKKASSKSEAISTLLCEIDFFKAYRDNYGSQGASFLLLVVGLALKTICDKHGCFLAHYENAVFVVLFQGEESEKVLEVAEALREAVEAAQTEHHFSSAQRVVTLSVGVANIYPNSMSLLMEKANNALQQAQSAGRNQLYGDFPRENIDEQFNFNQLLLDIGIADQSAFRKEAVALWKTCRNEKELLSMMICGVDFRQAYLEHYGQADYEDLLLIVAASLQEASAQKGSFIYHLDDDNFVLLLKGGNATRALKVAEQTHLFITQSATEHKFSEVSDLVTLSIGVASIFPNERNAMVMLKDEAKKAFHSAVKSGRNQTNVSY